jgi:hypothetical protein
MMGVLDGSDAVSPALELGDEIFDQGGLPGI